MRPGAVESRSAPASPYRGSGAPASAGSSFQSQLDAATRTVPKVGDSPVGKWLASGGRVPTGPATSASAATASRPSNARTSAVTAPRPAASAPASAPRATAAAPRSTSVRDAQARYQAARAQTPTRQARDDWARPPEPMLPPAPVAPAMPGNLPRIGAAGATAASAAPGAAMRLDAYPRPADDNGRGLHWIPTVRSTPEAVDRFVDKAKKMHTSWVVFLNEGADSSSNDYLVKKLVENGIEPVMRIYTPGVGPVTGDIEGMVRHYKALGVDYYQIGNEPNLRLENGGDTPNVNRYLDSWIPAARKVAAAGGLPGFGALAPGGDVDDLQFLRDALDGLKARGALDTLDKGWLAMHNYTGNRPVEFDKDSNGFLKFRWYDAIVREKLGRSLPVVGTEGGTYVSNRTDGAFPAVDPNRQVREVVAAMRYMDAPHEPYLFANSYWVIANAEGGGHDPQWEPHALFRGDGSSPIVAALQSLT